MDETIQELYEKHKAMDREVTKKERILDVKYWLSVIGIVLLPTACIVASITLTALDIVPITAIVLACFGGLTAFFVPKFIVSVHKEYEDELTDMLCEFLYKDVAILNQVEQIIINEQEEQNNEQ